MSAVAELASMIETTLRGWTVDGAPAINADVPSEGISRLARGLAFQSREFWKREL